MIAIYVRVSDQKKKDDGDRRQDINRQKEIISQHLQLKGLLDYSLYEDDGKSAFTDDLNQRPAFKQLLNDCRRHFIKEIYIEDMTRFSRNLSLGLQWLKELGEIGVNIISLKEGELEVTSSKGWMQSTMLLMFSEWDSRIKSEKVRSGMQKAKNLGKHIGRRRSNNEKNMQIL
jgi:DNA invertase Pin-like site-specific DNA recombinase